VSVNYILLRVYDAKSDVSDVTSSRMKLFNQSTSNLLRTNHKAQH